MGLRQEEEIRTAIARLFGADNDGSLCCTIATVNTEGQDVQLSGVLEELDHLELETVDYSAMTFPQIVPSSRRMRATNAGTTAEAKVIAL